MTPLLLRARCVCPRTDFRANGEVGRAVSLTPSSRTRAPRAILAALTAAVVNGCAASMPPRGDEVEWGGAPPPAASSRRFVQDARPRECEAGTQPAVVGLENKTPTWVCLRACQPGQEYVTPVSFVIHLEAPRGHPPDRVFAPWCSRVCGSGEHRIAYAVPTYEDRNCQEDGSAADSEQAAAQRREQAELARWWAAEDETIIASVNRELGALTAKATLERDDSARIADIRTLIGKLDRGPGRHKAPAPELLGRVRSLEEALHAVEARWRERVETLESSGRIARCEEACEPEECLLSCKRINAAACAVCDQRRATCRSTCR